MATSISPGFSELPQQTNPNSRGLLWIVFEAVIPIGVIEPDRKHCVAGEHQPFAAGRHANSRYVQECDRPCERPPHQCYLVLIIELPKSGCDTLE